MIISNGEMDNIIKIVKSLEESFKLKDVSEAIEMKQNNKNVVVLACY